MSPEKTNESIKASKKTSAENSLRPEITALLNKLQSYPSLFHPLRLAIIILLLKHYKLGLSEIKNRLNVSWGNLKFHVEELAEQGLIGISREFVNAKPRVMIYLKQEGLSQYKDFLNTIIEIQEQLGVSLS